MLKVEGKDLYPLRSPGGDQFTAFVDSIIRAHGYFLGLANAQIKTNQRTNVSDGGVDTAVDAPMPGDTTGWFTVPAIWQYKASTSGTITEAELKKEVNKPLATDYIKRGYGYRFCVCDNFAVGKQNEFRDILSAAIQKINPAAPPPIVLSADDLASWVCHYPPIVMAHFRRGLEQMARHFAAWKQSILVPTKTYVPVEAWKPIQEGIRQHIDFRSTPAQTIFPIQGEAGVGKTRMVFETFAALPEAAELALYASDETEAVKLANALANDGTLTVLLIVDECSVQTQLRLDEILRGFKGTVRVVAIDNTGIRPLTGAAENRVERMPNAVVLTILKENFPLVPPENREAYAALSSGFVRLAADLCANHARIAATGSIITGLGDVHRYYFQSDDRLQPAEKEILAALALFTKVGFKDEVAHEWADFCKLLKLDPEKTKRLADKLHDAPGFIGRGGRYFYVTPEAMAHLGFAEGWRRWAIDPPQFLKDIPESLLESFNARVAESASAEVRGLVAKFFRDWAIRLTSNDLADRTATLRLATLAEMSPEIFLPILADILEKAPLPEIEKISGKSNGTGNWGPRRTIVWLAEKMLRFPESFAFCERILLRLSLAESEKSIANNATAIWHQAFRIVLSGTATPFPERLATLQLRIRDTDEQISNLGLSGLKSLLESHFSRTAGPLVVGGRIPPAEWRPKTRAEEKSCRDAAAAIIFKLLGSPNKRLQQGAHRIAIERMRFLLLFGYQSDLQNSFSFEALSDQEGIKARGAIELFLQHDCAEDSKRGVPKPYADETRRWLESSRPKDFRGRLATLLSVEPWHYRDLESGEGERWAAQVRQLSQDFFSNKEPLPEYLDWLCSDAAKSAPVLGEELGKLDKDAKLFGPILDSCVRSGKSALGRGYLNGLTRAYPAMTDKVNAWLDRLQDTHSELAYEFFMTIPEATKGFSRLLTLFDAGKLPSWVFRSYTYGASRRELSLDQYEQILCRLVPKAEANDKIAHQLAIQIIGFELKGPLNATKPEPLRILARPSIIELVWRMLEIDGSDLGNEVYWRSEILDVFAKQNPARAIKLCVRDLVSDGYSVEEHAMVILTRLAKDHPKEVMEHFGAALLAEQGWKLGVGAHSALLRDIPLEMLSEWLTINGVAGARAIARHLPQPSPGPDGEPAIHPLTEYVLKTFEMDDELFHSFCAGAHHLQGYMGDIAGQHAAEGLFAKKLLGHPLRRIREWAQAEIDSANAQAAWWKQREEEDRLR